MQYRNVYYSVETENASAERGICLSSDKDYNDIFEMVVAHRGVEVADLSDTAMAEFAEKYIDLHYGDIAAHITQPVPPPKPALSKQAVKVACDIQRVANYLVKQCLRSENGRVRFSCRQIADELGISASRIMRMRDEVVKILCAHEAISHALTYGSMISLCRDPYYLGVSERYVQKQSSSMCQSM